MNEHAHTAWIILDFVFRRERYPSLNAQRGQKSEINNQLAVGPCLHGHCSQLESQVEAVCLFSVAHLIFVN